jgi:hypothetical protein
MGAGLGKPPFHRHFDESGGHGNSHASLCDDGRGRAAFPDRSSPSTMGAGIRLRDGHFAPQFLHSKIAKAPPSVITNP